MHEYQNDQSEPGDDALYERCCVRRLAPDDLALVEMT